MRIAIVYHKIDCDGLCSYAVIYHALKEQYADRDDLEIVGIGYNHNNPTPDLDGFDTVYVVDICLPAETMLELRRKCNLIWIDHHATSIAMSREKGFSDVMGLRTIGVGACLLCWRFMYPAVPEGQEPIFVRLLSAYDVFDKNAFPWDIVTLPYQYAVRNRLGLEPAEFVKALEDENYLGHHILAEGNAIVQYVRQQGARAARAYGFDVMIDGKVKALCLLTGDFGSIPLELTAKERGAEVIINCNRVDAGVYKVSVFAVDGDAPIDLGAYMKAFYTGGGHHNAAGGMLTQENFLNLINNQVL